MGSRAPRTILIAFRALQGIGAALLTPAALSLLVTTFTEARERNLALGIWAAAAGSGGAAGLLLGGALTSGLSWRWIFFITVPVGVAVALLSPVLLRENRAEGAARTFDFAGAASITGGLMLLVYGLTRASQHGWGKGTTVGLLAGAAALIAAFVAIEWRSREPLLPLRLFRLRALSGSNLAILLAAGASIGVLLLTTLYLQDVLHYSAIKTGVSYLAWALCVVGFATVAQSLVGRVGIWPLVTAGSLLEAGALVLLARLPVHGHYFADVFPAFLLFGTGSALVFVPGQIGAQAGVRAEGRRRRVRPDQHQPAGRRRDHGRGRRHAGHHGHEPLPPPPHGRPRGRERGDGPRLPRRVSRARDRHQRGRRAGRAPDQRNAHHAKLNATRDARRRCPGSRLTPADLRADGWPAGGYAAGHPER